MIATLKIYLYPSKMQETKMLGFCHTARFVYNWALGRKIEDYNLYGETLKLQDLITELQELKATEDYDWLNNTAEAVTKQSIKDLFVAYNNFFKQGKGFPKFKSKNRSKLSFYQRTDKVKLHANNSITITGIGRVKVKKCNWLPRKPINPRVVFDGKYWYLTIGHEVLEQNIELTDNSIGVDLGIKKLAVRSDGVEVPNINKSRNVKVLERKLKTLQRKVSNKYENNKMRGGSYNKTKNILKVEGKIKLIHRRLKNIRDNHIHNATSDIVKAKPCRVVVEDLNVKGMMKNKHLAKAIANQGFYKFQTYLEYKCKFWGIAFVKAERTFPSSKLCSCCGSKKAKLSLSERTYICTSCGMVKDRDLNAAENLAKYTIA
ncbi:putative transposase [compost metagenome]